MQLKLSKMLMVNFIGSSCEFNMLRMELGLTGLIITRIDKTAIDMSIR